MAINRVFYASQVVYASPENLPANNAQARALFGLQSVGVNTNFNLEQSFELGQLEIYDNAEGVAEVEVTLEKVLDGYAPLYSILTRSNTSPYWQEGAESTRKLLNRSTKRCNLALQIHDEEVNPTGTPNYQLFLSGMYINNISYNFPSDGPFTESITLVGNNKLWSTASAGAVPTVFSQGTSLTYLNSGVMRRQNLVLSGVSSELSPYVSDLPTDAADEKIQSISISVDLGREDLLELGSKAPFYRAPNFPVEVTCDIETLTQTGDQIDINEDALTNLTNKTIFIALSYDPVTSSASIKPQYTFDLGSQNKLSSVTYGGGDATGGNATVTYSYTNFNDFTVPGSVWNYTDPSYTDGDGPGTVITG